MIGIFSDYFGLLTKITRDYGSLQACTTLYSSLTVEVVMSSIWYIVAIIYIYFFLGIIIKYILKVERKMEMALSIT